jgi:hypothetical protein
MPVAVELEVCKSYSKQTTKSSVRETSMDIIPVISTWNKTAIRDLFKDFKSSVPAQL